MPPERGGPDLAPNTLMLIKRLAEIGMRQVNLPRMLPAAIDGTMRARCHEGAG
jgi:hypothetical protein